MPAKPKPHGTTLRLLLGDQLNPRHSWFAERRADVVYALMEVRQETDYVRHHAQKLLAIFAAMRAFGRRLERDGHRVRYLRISDPANRHDIPANIKMLMKEERAAGFEWQEPDEWRLDAQLSEFSKSLPAARRVSSEHFYCDRGEAAGFFGAKARWTMEPFYRQLRQREKVLLDPQGKPQGGRWNFDAENRKAWKGQPPEPADWRRTHDHSALWREIEQAGVRSFGEPRAQALPWPLDREEALEQLEAFATKALPHFGDYQDALGGPARRLFHSLLSFALNTKMLDPREVVGRVEQAWKKGRVSLPAAEGFIRQILGWREYVRGVYWHRMPSYTASNALAHSEALPDWFWKGGVRMACLADAIGQSLEEAYAHHIQRLMVIGNFALLAGLDPQALHRWYLGVYIDAFEWVEAPNTLGMSQYADGGLLATKPYVSSAAYLGRMGAPCKRCPYDPKLRVGVRACPYNALYWDFLDRHAGQLSKNVRLAMPYKLLGGMESAEKEAFRARAKELRAGLDEL